MDKVLFFLLILIFLNTGVSAASESCITGFACKINNTLSDKKTDITKQKTNTNNKKNKNVPSVNTEKDTKKQNNNQN